MSEPLIAINHVSFRYNSQRLILDRVSASLSAGQMVSLLGPNGAGKSTLLRCIMGQLRLAEGEIIMCGKNVSELSYRERAMCTAYVPQHSAVVFDHSVRDYVAMGLAGRYPMWKAPSSEDMREVDRYIERMELTALAHMPFRALSGGEQQKTAIARALVQRPRILLFDEPTSALDLGNQNKVLQMVKSLAQEGYSIIMTTHNPNHPFVLGGDVWMLDHSGHLEAGTLEETMTARKISDLYGTSVDVVTLPEYQQTVCLVTE